MRNFVLILFALLLLAGCKSTKSVEKEVTVDVRVRDSVVIRDSVVYQFLSSLRDSVVIRDSIIIVKDIDGKVIATERHRSTLREKDRNTSIDSQSKGSRLKAVEKKENRQRKVDSKFTSHSPLDVVHRVAWIVFFIVVLLTIYKTRRLWKSWFKTDRP